MIVLALALCVLIPLIGRRTWPFWIGYAGWFACLVAFAYGWASANSGWSLGGTFFGLIFIIWMALSQIEGPRPGEDVYDNYDL